MAQQADGMDGVLIAVGRWKLKHNQIHKWPKVSGEWRAEKDVPLAR
jgi:hypothetical protein